MTFLRMADGTIVHVRVAKPRRRRCSVCLYQTPPLQLRECDFELENGQTCDRLMCIACAKRVAPDKDLCPDHFPTKVTP